MQIKPAPSHIALLVAAPILLLGALQASCGGTTLAPEARPTLAGTREVHLENIKQLTFGAGENIRASWSVDGSEVLMQSKRKPFFCDQSYRLPINGSEPKLVSTGLGRTRESHFLPGARDIVFSSTHATGDMCPDAPGQSQGHVWPVYAQYDIYRAKASDRHLQKLTDSFHYDAEATVCALDGSILFTSTRNGDLDLYRMDPDGGNVVQLTDTPGYDGGAVFSRDCSQIAWRASRPIGESLQDYQKLLARGLVRPGHLELFVANANGENARQITYLNASSLAPSFYPSGTRIVFSSDVGAKGGDSNIWAVNTDGTELERITDRPGFDGFPMFSPDGSKLAFSSHRNQAKEGEIDVYIADWVDSGKGEIRETRADAFATAAAWLADDAREGRGVGTAGIEVAAEWIAQQFASMGLAEAGESEFFQSLQVTTSVALGTGNTLKIAKASAVPSDFWPLGFSASGSVSAASVFVGHGIVDAKLDVDEYKGRKVAGNIAVAYRYTPSTKAFSDAADRERTESLHRKASVALEHGAVALLIIDEPYPGTKNTEEQTQPELSLHRLGSVGIPVVIARSTFARRLATRSASVSLTVDLDLEQSLSRNVVAKLAASSAGKRIAPLVIGAHYDHLESGGKTSLGEEGAVHTDDSASGVAGLLQVARRLVAVEGLSRDIYFVAFTGKENGHQGSKHFVEQMPKDAAPIAMLNLDTIGRMRENHLSVVGTTTAREWEAIASDACEGARVQCTLGGDGYGAGDHRSFTLAGIPALSISTGVLADSHKPSDETSRINSAGGAAAADVLFDIALALVSGAESLSGGVGASLGTIPDKGGDRGMPGMLLAGVRPGGAADKAGMRAGDRILAIGDTSLRTAKDLAGVLHAAAPGDDAIAKVQRGDTILMLKFTFGESKPQ